LFLILVNTYSVIYPTGPEKKPTITPIIMLTSDLELVAQLDVNQKSSSRMMKKTTNDQNQGDYQLG
jgi:hypothetical protein